MEQKVDAGPSGSMVSADVANGEAGVLDRPVDAGAAPRSVTFRTEPAQQAEQACVVGDFNDWSLSADPMVRVDDHFEATIQLMPQRAYRYRYLFDGYRWENDWHAQRYEPNAFGGDDSVIDLSEDR